MLIDYGLLYCTMQRRKAEVSVLRDEMRCAIVVVNIDLKVRLELRGDVMVDEKRDG